MTSPIRDPNIETVSRNGVTMARLPFPDTYTADQAAAVADYVATIPAPAIEHRSQNTHDTLVLVEGKRVVSVWPWDDAQARRGCVQDRLRAGKGDA